MANRFRVDGDSGTNWNDPQYWSTTTGGAGGSSVPSTSDVAIFDVNSGNCTLEQNIAVIKIDIQAAYASKVDFATYNVSCVGSGAALLFAGGTLDGGTGLITLNPNTSLKALNISGGTFNAETCRITCKVNASGNTFTADSNQDLWDLDVDMQNTGRYFTATGTVVVKGTLNWIESARFAGTLECHGDVNITATNTIRMTGLLKIAGSTSQTVQVNGSGGTGKITRIEIASTGGTVTFNDTIEISGDTSTCLRYTSGTVAYGAGAKFKIVGSGLASADHTVNMGAQAVNDFEWAISNASSDGNVTGTLTVEGDLSFTAGAQVDGGTIEVEGDVSTTVAGMTGTTAITLTGNATQSLSLGTGRVTKGTFTVNKTGGVAKCTAAFVLAGTGQDMLIAAGVFCSNGSNVTINDRVDINAGAEFRKFSGDTMSPATPDTGAYTTVDFCEEVHNWRVKKNADTEKIWEVSN